MSPPVFVHWLPTLFEPEELRGGIAVVIDVLRASTTMVQALSAGAKAVVPCVDVSEAHTLAATFPAGTFVLGGERDGVKIPGFDLGNSPLEYTPEAVGGRTVIFTTTNGTRALDRCRFAERVVIGSFVNLEVTARFVGKTSLPVHLVCAGTNGQTSAEDVLCAGALVSDLRMLRGQRILSENDAARMAYELYAFHSQERESLLNALRESGGGRNLLALGYDADVEWSVRRSLYELVPEWFPQTGRIETSATG